MPSGILIIDKPQGWTSMDVCAKLRGLFHERRVGHGGTLDPMATGVLPIFLGRATRAVELAAGADKEYIAVLKLGVVTNTQDLTGQVLETRPVTVGAEEVEAALAAFRGPILQVPPMYSAVKVHGKKLYELARKGREVEREPRRVVIRGLEVTRQISFGEYELRVLCSKGTYVRTLCHDLGQALGCGGCMAALRRISAGGFALSGALPLEEVLASEDPAGLLRPVDSLFARLPAVRLSSGQSKKVRNGVRLTLPELPDGDCRVYDDAGEFLALCRAEQGRLAVVKSFFEV